VRLNIIIPSYQASETIGDCLRSVHACRDVSDIDFDITVVDSSPHGDTTRDIVKTIGFDLQLIELPERAFPGRGRNVGVQNTSGDILCFIDADAVADSNWIKAIYDKLTTETGIDAVGGAVLNKNSAPPNHNYSWLAHWCEFSGYGLGAPEGPRRVQPTVNVAIRREAFDKYGPFLEEQFGCEDVLLFQRMKNDGSILYFQCSQVVYHRNKTKLDDIFNHQYKLGESTGRARVTYDLPGSFLQNPALSWLVPFIKTHFVGYRLYSQERSEYNRYLKNTHLVMKAMNHFYRGFKDGVKSVKGEKK